MKVINGTVTPELADLVKKGCRKCHGRGYTAMMAGKPVFCSCVVKAHGKLAKAVKEVNRGRG